MLIWKGKYKKYVGMKIQNTFEELSGLLGSSSLLFYQQDIQTVLCNPMLIKLSSLVEMAGISRKSVINPNFFGNFFFFK